MAVPQSKTSPSRRGMRRAHDHLESKSLSVCANCGATKRPHHICPQCGHYKGRAVLDKSGAE
ncbi:MAG: 50S ribosomal protein L32 [Pseudomonadota bacterium]|uniref:50S ribosomal protein L32 n=1 Tax=Thermithiobacillus tepidarius TaxID=929 RepID=UPI00048D7580|nr:50S ribosomal protein L32 [Thermithiobacillus tepidarius]